MNSKTLTKTESKKPLTKCGFCESIIWHGIICSCAGCQQSRGVVFDRTGFATLEF